MYEISPVKKSKEKINQSVGFLFSQYLLERLLTGVSFSKNLEHCPLSLVKGSHVILAKIVNDQKIALVVPLHKEIDKGTLIEIIRQARLKREEFVKLL